MFTCSLWILRQSTESDLSLHQSDKSPALQKFRNMRRSGVVHTQCDHVCVLAAADMLHGEQ